MQSFTAPKNHEPRPWELPLAGLPKPLANESGCVIDGEAQPCAVEDFVSVIEKFGIARARYFWTPENLTLQPPENLPQVVPLFAAQAKKIARRSVGLGLIVIIVSVVLIAFLGEWNYLFRNIFFLLGAYFLARGMWDWRKARSFTKEDARKAATVARFGAWVGAGKLTFTNYLAAAIIAVGIAQLFKGIPASIESAGLVKPAVRAGEYWRMLTAGLMHVNFIHFWMNFIALQSFGRLIERIAQPVFVALVFAVAAVIGSLFSLWLYPQTTSVGASGGLMGFIGFIAVASYFRRDIFPLGFFQTALQDIAWIAVIGVIGFAFIDNGAHLGGLVGGIVVGLLTVARKDADFPLRSGKLLGALGAFSLAIIFAAALYAIFVIWRTPLLRFMVIN